MWNRMTVWWCKTMHAGAMWPVNGKYICPDCLREYPVAWNSLPAHPEYPQPKQRRYQSEGRISEQAFPARSRAWSARLAVQHVVGTLKRFDTM
jgi:hypothetical protein